MTKEPEHISEMQDIIVDCAEELGIIDNSKELAANIVKCLHNHLCFGGKSVYFRKRIDKKNNADKKQQAYEKIESIVKDVSTKNIFLNNSEELDRVNALARNIVKSLNIRYSRDSVYFSNRLDANNVIQKRNIEIIEKYNGVNIDELRMEYGLSEVQIYKITKDKRDSMLMRDIFTDIEAEVEA